MNCPTCQTTIDLTAVSDAAIRSEWNRRCSMRRVTRSGGPGGARVWGEHNPNAKNCRCEKCIAERSAQ